jgi:hypothetical protein
MKPINLTLKLKTLILTFSGFLLWSCATQQTAQREIDDSYITTKDLEQAKADALAKKATQAAEAATARNSAEEDNSGNQPDYVNPDYKSSRPSGSGNQSNQTSPNITNNYYGSGYYNSYGGFGNSLFSPYPSTGFSIGHGIGMFSPAYSWGYPGWSSFGFGMSNYYGYRYYNPWNPGFGFSSFYSPYYDPFMGPAFGGFSYYSPFYNPYMYYNPFYSPFYNNGGNWNGGGNGGGNWGDGNQPGSGRVRTNQPISGMTGTPDGPNGGRTGPPPTGGRSGDNNPPGQPANPGGRQAVLPTEPQNNSGWRSSIFRQESGQTGGREVQNPPAPNPEPKPQPSNDFWRSSDPGGRSSFGSSPGGNSGSSGSSGGGGGRSGGGGPTGGRRR